MLAWTGTASGTKHFGIWPLREAPSCFGPPEWPDHLAVPQGSIESELADPEAVHAAAKELEGRAFTLLHAPREEPWGQTSRD